MERDPVCGMTVPVAKAAASAEHAGKTYYFFAQSCAQRFRADPEKYLRPSVTLPSAGAAPSEQDPVCGMTVNPARAAAALDYHGKKYYFCHPRCAERFRQEPQRFLKVDVADGGYRAAAPETDEAAAGSL